MKVTYYLDIFSSWCYWAEPAWADLKTRFAGRVDFDWRIALMRPENFPASAAQCDWFYQRSGMVMRSPFMLNSGWYDPARNGDYVAANFVAEAGRALGCADDRLRLALMHAALREGRKIGELKEAVAVAAQATGLPADAILKASQSTEVRKQVEKSTADFFAHQINQRPAFILEDAIGDKAVFSGLARLEGIAATIEAMLLDEAVYASHKAHFGVPPVA